MKIKINPLSQVRLRAERAVNFYRVVTPQDLAHDRKRQLARDIKAGGAPTDEFVKAAELEGKTVTDLVDIILGKPDVMMEVENARRAIIVRIRAAQSADEVKAILAEEGIGENPADRGIEMV